MTQMIPAFRAQVERRIQEAIGDLAIQIMDGSVEWAYLVGFQAGLTAGAERMRQSIIAAAQAPFDVKQKLDPSAPPEPAGRISASETRAPRGALRVAIHSALEETPGITTRQLEAAVERIDPSVSGRSVSAELRRKENRLYRKERGQWFLMGEAVQAQKETAEPRGPAELLNLTAQEEPDAPATIAA